MTKERDYYKSIRRAVLAVNSAVSTNKKLATIVRGVARSMKCGASLVLLDSTRTSLIHTSSWGLPQFFLRKGLVDATKSLSEVFTGKPVIVPDTGTDKRVQYPEITRKAGITSILGVPVSTEDRTIGSIRVYAREHLEFTNQDVAFVTAMANLAAIALGNTIREEPVKATGTLRQARSVTFAHPSEEEFARILDFYNVEWVYEPRSFPLRWQGDRIREMFTPDFYLPGLDLYIELTTMKQSLVTGKNRKLRRLRELYPDIKITLLYKNDYDHLLAKYGVGPLAQTRAQGISRVLHSASEINEEVRKLAEQISRDYANRRPILIGVLRGVFCFMADLIRHITIPLDVDFMAISHYGGGDGSTVRITKDVNLVLNGRDVIVVEDIVDTGITLSYILNHLREKGAANLKVCTLLDRRASRLVELPLEYIGFEVSDEFVVGYGLDYREEYRNLPFIAIPLLGKAITAKKESPR